MLEALGFAGVAALAGYLLTHFAVRALPRLGLLSKPDPNHPVAVPVGGGIVLWAVALLAFVVIGVRGYPPAPLANIFAGATCLFLAGLWDDAYPLAPRTKLLAQLAAATLVIVSGVTFPLGPGMEWVAVPLTLFWLVGLCNAFNLIDNMDGMLPGVAAAAAVFVGFFAFATDRTATGLLSWAVAGASLGFLRHNLPPARILLGDSGSMFLGFLLAGLAIGDSWRGMTHVGMTVLAPAMLLAVPIFNATFVTLTRKLRGVPVSRGQADHINYRLLAHGLSHGRALAAVYALSVVAGVLGLMAITVAPLTYAAGAALFLVILFYAGAFLYDGHVQERFRDFLVKPSRRGWEQSPWYRWVMLFGAVSGDVLLVFAALYLAFHLRFDGVIPADQLQNMAAVLPYLLLFRVGLALMRGIYDTRWRFASTPDTFRLAGTVLLGSLLFATLLLALRLPSFPRTVVVIEGMLTLLFVAGTRLGVRRLGEVTAREREAREGKRTIIAGSSDGAISAYREIRARNGGDYHVVGFAEAGPRIAGGRIQGVPVLGPISRLVPLARLAGAEHVVLAYPKGSGIDVETHLQAALAAGLTAEVLKLEIVSGRTWLARRNRVGGGRTA